MPITKAPHIFYFTVFVVFIIVMVTTGCGQSEEKSQPQSAIPLNKDSKYLETGDLPELKARGNLRILAPRFSENSGFLPRKGFPLYNETALLSEFATEIGLSPSLIYVEDFDQIIPMLVEGQGDLIAANMTITDARSKLIGFTTPLDIVQEEIVVPVNSSVAGLNDLKGKRIAVQKSTSYYDSLLALTEKQPEIGVEIVPENMTILSILDGVADGKFEAAIADSNILEAALTYDKQLKIIHSIEQKRAIAWGIRKKASKLKAALDKFVNEQQFMQSEYPVFKADLSEIKKRKKLRVLTRNNAATYFLWKGQLLGFEYELAKEFAKQQNLKLEMIVAPSREALYEWLLQGKGDLIAASLTFDPNLDKVGIKFSESIKSTTEMLVARADDTIKDVSELAGRTIYVRKSSSYWKSVNKLIEGGLALVVKAAPEEMETEEIISKVAQGEFDLTVSDSHILDIELTWREDVKAAFSLGEPINHGWVVRAEDTELLAEINKYIKTEYRGLFYNITHRKYFEKPRTIRKRLTQRVDGHGEDTLSPYDEMVKKHVVKYGFDWRLILAQMYQESRFNPNAQSWAGAKGLMQVMPVVARQLNVTDLTTAENGIEAGIRYMDWLTKRFEIELLENERVWFTLAAYNAGIGHVRDARRLARQKGWDTSRWFDNVEKAMLLLSKQEYAKKARYGYVRGSEPVKYVREIKSRFKAYRQLTGENSL